MCLSSSNVFLQTANLGHSLTWLFSLLPFSLRFEYRPYRMAQQTSYMITMKASNDHHFSKYNSTNNTQECHTNRHVLDNITLVWVSINRTKANRTKNGMKWGNRMFKKPNFILFFALFAFVRFIETHTCQLFSINKSQKATNLHSCVNDCYVLAESGREAQENCAWSDAHETTHLKRWTVAVGCPVDFFFFFFICPFFSPHLELRDRRFTGEFPFRLKRQEDARDVNGLLLLLQNMFLNIMALNYYLQASAKILSPFLKFPPQFCLAKWPAHA